jgi:hypothetical protein
LRNFNAIIHIKYVVHCPKTQSMLFYVFRIKIPRSKGGKSHCRSSGKLMTKLGPQVWALGSPSRILSFAAEAATETLHQEPEDNKANWAIRTSRFPLQ